MQDGAPCHRAMSVKKFLASKKIQILPWPGNSPDMNPIENLWAIIKRRLKTKNITTEDQLIKTVEKIWYEDPEIQSLCPKLIESMPNRIDDNIANKGFHTKY